ncbi:PIG-L deacetylase family protein [Prauserella endophytica]|uniref:PIG-L family deacetylase n=1 Tax=Prauserella endophytica TaxID=1592324 RepID=A0ABY2S834_9PSEU|nr:PIG-L family deacetylase [Prauserella endophytica]TKG72034.1 PIG-L family deacetylase [Prauserella endophytica]
MSTPGGRTVVAFHAHADDEVLLTGGTLARLAAEGHRVVIVVASDSADEDKARVRAAELRASARILGAARVAHLGYADSGHGPLLFADPPGRTRFVRADVGEAAAKLAALLREERADLLLSYDPRGGYGHRDHVHVHHVGLHAAALTGVRVLEATMPREPVARAYDVLTALRVPLRYDRDVFHGAFSPRAEITHRYDVRAFAARKRAALAAHESQVGGGGRVGPLFRGLLRLPVPIFAVLFGREWFVEAQPRSGAQGHVGGGQCD